MIKARGKIGEFDTFMIGLTAENITRMRNNEPIVFSGEPYGVPMTIMIMVGDTEEDIAERLGVDLKTDPRAKPDNEPGAEN